MDWAEKVWQEKIRQHGEEGEEEKVIHNFSDNTPVLIARGLNGWIKISVLSNAQTIVVSNDKSDLQGSKDPAGNFAGTSIAQTAGPVQLNWVGDLWAIAPAAFFGAGTPIVANFDIGGMPNKQNAGVSSGSGGRVAHIGIPTPHWHG